MDQEDQPAARPGIRLQLVAVGVFLCLAVVLPGATSLSKFGFVYLAGFGLGVLTAGWWSVAVVVAGLFVDDLIRTSSHLGPTLAAIPASVAFGVLGAKLRRSDSGARTAPGMAKAGGLILAIGVAGLVVAFTGYHDDTPISGPVAAGLSLALVGFTVGPGLLFAALVASSR